jgi:hypothetical protein
VNHGCDPNCQSTTEKKRIFIEAIRTIQPGEELAYDYQIQRDDDDPPDVDQIFACRCGAKNCRGVMLEPRKPKKKAVKKEATQKVATQKVATQKKSAQKNSAKRGKKRGNKPGKNTQRQRAR